MLYASSHTPLPRNALSVLLQTLSARSKAVLAFRKIMLANR